MSEPEWVPELLLSFPFTEWGQNQLWMESLKGPERLSNAWSVGVKNGPLRPLVGLLYHSATSALPSSGNMLGTEDLLICSSRVLWEGDTVG